MLLVRNPSSRPLLPRRRPRAIACAADFRGTTRLLCQNLPLGVTLGGQPAICATPCLQSCPPWRDNSGFVPEFGCERPPAGQLDIRARTSASRLCIRRALAQRGCTADLHPHLSRACSQGTLGCRVLSRVRAERSTAEYPAPERKGGRLVGRPPVARVQLSRRGCTRRFSSRRPPQSRAVPPPGR